MIDNTARSANLDRAARLDPVFAQLAGASTVHAWAVPELTEREKVFLCVTADVVQPALGLAFELHVRAAATHGVSTSDIRELLRFISYDSGYIAALEGFARLAEIEAELGLTSEPAPALPPELVSTGPDAAPSPLPEPLRAQIRDLDPNFGEYFDLQSRMRSAPGTLSDREKAFVTMSIDVHYQTLEATFRAHVDRALRNGATREDVRAVLRFIAQFGATRVWRGWDALNAYFAELDA
jgi:alkylhydroperoxidase/carboxymuconolactone decarboxylase family protein YurZ